MICLLNIKPTSNDVHSGDDEVHKIRGQSLLAALTARPQNEPPSKRTPLSSFDTVFVYTPNRLSSVTEIAFLIQLTQYIG